MQQKILFVNTIKPRGVSEAICIKQHLVLWGFFLAAVLPDVCRKMEIIPLQSVKGWFTTTIKRGLVTNW